MLGILTRSRSLRGGGGGGGGGGGAAHAGDPKAHGPNPAPVTAEPGLVSGPTLQDSTVLGLIEKADVAPSSSLDGRRECPYVNRPLPPPPPQKSNSAATMPARPGTSSGPSSEARGGFSRPKFDRRISRDDMFLNPSSKTATAFDKRISRDDMYLGTKPTPARAAFQRPFRGQLPTPEASPLGNAPPISSVPARMATPESLMSGEIQIGMALGSPTNLPTTMPTTWQPQIPLATQSSVSIEPAVSSEPPTLHRSKTGRRKLFGLFGSRRHHEANDSGAAMMTTATAAAAAAAAAASATAQSSADKLPARSNTVADRKAPKYQPLIGRTDTEPSTPPNPVKESRGLRPFLRSKASEPTIRQQQKDNKFSNSSTSNLSSQQNLLRPPQASIPPPPITTSPYLDIEIPDVKMERYSIMFGSLLHQNQTQQPASSLLARRQATLEKLKTINDRIIQEEEEAKERARQRRVTSPQLAKSPGLALFPPTPSSRRNDSPTIAPVQRLSPRVRSNTSPAMLHSPVKPSFEHDPMRADWSRGNFLKINPLRENPAMRPGFSREPQREPQREAQREPVREAPKVIQFDPSQSSFILDSPTEMTEDVDKTRGMAQLFRPSIPEPQWQMISPSSSATPSTAPSSASSLRKRSPSSVSSVQTNLTRPSMDLDEVGDGALKSAVEISIARQISISRQQRQLLRPLQTNVQPARARASPGSAGSANTSAGAGAGVAVSTRGSPVRKALVGRIERVQETKSTTPTLVHPSEALDSQLGQHRRSERVILETA